MKKHYIFYLFFLVTVNFTSVQACEKHSRIDQLLIDSGVSASLEQLQLSIYELLESSDLSYVDRDLLTRNIEAVILPEKTLKTIRDALFKALTVDEVELLSSWYQTLLGKRFVEKDISILKRENISHIVENYTSLVEQNTDRASIINSIFDALKGDQMIIDFKQFTMKLVLATIKQQYGLNDSLDDLANNTNTNGGENNTIRAIIIASAIYSYSDFTDEELSMLKDFSLNEVTLKFYSIIRETFKSCLENALTQLTVNQDPDNSLQKPSCCGCSSTDEK